MITKPQYKILKSISYSNGTKAKDYDSKKEMYDYLFAQGYIKKYDVRGHRGYIVTETGKVEMKLYRDDTRRFWITTSISFIALVTSIISILLQSETLQTILLQLLK